MITVLNIKNAFSIYDRSKVVYIGRQNDNFKASPLANPFKLNTYPRNESIQLYNDWIHAAIKCNDKLAVSVRNELNRLYKIAKQGDLYLICWCKPLPCHGDIIKQMLEERL